MTAMDGSSGLESGSVSQRVDLFTEHLDDVALGLHGGGDPQPESAGGFGRWEPLDGLEPVRLPR